MSTFMYKDKPLAEPGKVDFGNTDISGIGDGTVTGAIKELDSKNTLISLTKTAESKTFATGEINYIDINILEDKYTALGVVGFDVKDGNINLINVGLTGSNVRLWVKNTSSSSITVNGVTVTVLYQKQ